MKPSAVEAADKGARPSDGMQAKSEKIRSLKNIKKDTGKPEKLKYKPLTGKVFYLDIPSNVISEKIGKDLKELGGEYMPKSEVSSTFKINYMCFVVTCGECTQKCHALYVPVLLKRVESFLSKDISYLVSNKKEAKFAPSLGRISPVPSPESAGNGGNSSPHPSNRKDRHDGSSFKIVDTVRMSRGKSLVEKAIKEQDLIPSGSILSNALSWGVKILHIDDVKNYIEQKKKELYLIKRAGSSSKDVGKQITTQKSRSRLKNPFVKVEDRSRFARFLPGQLIIVIWEKKSQTELWHQHFSQMIHLYRPFYLQLPIFPVLNYCVPKPYSPFEVEKKHPSGQKQTQSKQRAKVNSDKDCGTPVQLPQKDKKRRGYCECCGKKYEDLQTHLESEQHQNFAQSTQYQVVDDIISKFVYKFVEYKDDEKIKRTKCSTGCFSPTTGKITRPDELKERLKKQRISLKSYSWRDTTMRALKLDRQPVEVQPNSVPIPPPLSGSVCSVLHCHLAQPSELQIKFRNNDENTKTDCSCAANLRQTVVSSYFIQSPPRKDDKAYTETLSQAYESSNKEILQLEVNKKNLQCFQEGMCASCSHAEVTEFSEKDKNPLQPKRKLNNAVVLPAKCLKKTDANPTFVEKHHDFCDNHQQMQHNVVLEAEVSDTAINKELNELAVSTTPSSPSGKLHRKVKLYLGRNKKETQKQNLELCVKYTNGLSVPEQKRSSCSSPVQALLELFQTSERNSEFGGFSGYTESKGTTSMKDIWEGQNTNIVWSLFSSSSSSPFVGF